MARIIAADDDLGLQRVYTHMLDTLGHEFVICCNGQEAVDAFRKKPADLLILDITMPVMSGLDACMAIRKIPQGVHVPIIIVSANDSEDDIAEGFNAGADDYLLKPIRETALVAKLKNFLKISSLNRKELDLLRNKVNFLDRYKIDKAIGYGAHSVVFLAEDTKNPGCHVAIKLLNENVSDDVTLRRFVELVSQFQHLSSEHIIKIYDYGQHNGQIYLILEYASSGNLKKLLTAHQLTEKEACILALQIIDALEELQRHDLTHLDIKPENIIIHEDRYKLTDFGMVYSRDTATMPLKSEVWGTISYVCPESLEETSPLTIQSDIYSLGITIFEAVTGDNPFLSGKPLVSMFRQVNFIPMPISILVEGFSCEFSELVSSMMSKNPSERSTLEGLRNGFQFIYDCLESGKAKKRLSYPDPEERKKLLQTQESSAKKTRTMLDGFFRDEEKEKSAIGRFFDKIGNAVYGTLMYDSKKVSPANRKVMKPLIILIIAAVLFNGVGYIAVSYFHYKPEIKEDLPSIKTMCRKCGKIEVRKLKNINDASCSECRGPLGFAMECQRCKNVFPWVKPTFPKGTGRSKRNRETQKSLVCPACGFLSSKYIPPKDEGSKNEKKKSEKQKNKKGNK